MAAKRTETAEKAEKAEKAKKAKKTEAAEKSEKTARAGKAKKTGQAGQAAGDERDLTRGDIIGRYLEIYRRCMTEDPKSFDARGAASALEQISKLLGLTVSAKDTEGNEIVLTLSEEADALGQ